MALLDQAKNQRRPQNGGQQRPQGGTPERPPQEGKPRGGGDDVMAAVEGAMASEEFSELGIGTELASEEEQMKLGAIVDSVQQAIHGNSSDRIVQLLEQHKEPYQGLGAAGHVLTIAAYMQANKQGMEPGTDVFLAENGVVQTTMELLWEVAVSMGKVDNNDDEQFAAALLDVQRRIGETILEEDNPQAIRSAQEMLLEMETGEPVTQMMPGDRPEGMAGPDGQPQPEPGTEGPPGPSRGPQRPGGGNPLAGLDPRQQSGMPSQMRGGF